MLKIVNATLEGPDGDGDMRPEINIEYENNSDRPIEFVSSKALVLTSGGLLASSDSDENDDYVESGEIWSRELGGAYFKSSILEGQEASVMIEVLGCACNHHQLGSFEVSSGSIVGLGDKTEIGDGITLRSLTVSASNPDDDGDVNLEIKALLDNAGAMSIPRAVLSGKLMRSGREIEEISNYSDPLPPNQLTVLEASSYVKQRQLASATIEVKISLFPVVSRETAVVEFS